MDIGDVIARIEIEDLISTYNRLSDVGRYDEWVQLFADGGVFDGGFDRYVFPGDLERFKRASFAVHDRWPNCRHSVTSVETKIDGDTATSTCSFMLMTTDPGGEPRIMQAGSYADELVREQGRWRFAARVITLDGFEQYAPPPP